MMAARAAAELAKRMRFAMSPGGLLIHGEVMRLFYAALPYVEAAAAQPAPDWDPLGGPIVPGDFPPHPDAAELVRSTYPPSATAQPAPEPNCPRCEDPEAPTLHRHPPAPEPQCPLCKQPLGPLIGEQPHLCSGAPPALNRHDLHWEIERHLGGVEEWTPQHDLARTTFELLRKCQRMIIRPPAPEPSVARGSEAVTDTPNEAAELLPDSFEVAAKMLARIVGDEPPPLDSWKPRDWMRLYDVFHGLSAVVRRAIPAPPAAAQPPVPEPGDADAVISAVIRKYGLEPKEPTATAQRARELLLSAPITHRQWGLDVRDFLREIAEETK